ncbi:hypothetical protein [Morganella psychrotolerans]|uniref:hypothetical protein n=1 Tax=Morganella psychrotolerans TaxID=368603 RepID=UPI0012E909FE|nr:hypothetical protein [Morganella psychrotolerans]
MTEREQFAKDNAMSMDFVNWFFDNKKDGCGNVWFMMLRPCGKGGRDWLARGLSHCKLLTGWHSTFITP